MRRRVERLLRWYPPAWRRRYGDELTALIEDMGELSPRFRRGLVAGGLRERLHEARRPRPPAERVRTGVLLVLASWAVVMVAGPSFANLADGFTRALPRQTGSVPVVAYAAVVTFAATGALTLLAGVAVASPSFLRLIRAGGGASLRPLIRRALLVTAVGGLAFVALVATTHTLGPVQRSAWSLAAFCVGSALWVVVIALWTMVGGTAWRRMDVSARLLRVESALALTSAASTVLLTAASAIWWAAIAAAAPRFLESTPGHPVSSYLNPQALATELVLALGTLLALWGAIRARRPIPRVLG